MINSVGAVIVTFFPDEGFFDRITKIKEQVAKLVIVNNGINNSQKSNIIRLVNRNEILFIDLESNQGISKALNRGCLLLKKYGFKHAILFDQDSLVSENLVFTYIILSKEKNCGLVGPQIIPKNVKLDNIKNKLKYLVPSETFCFKREYVSERPLRVLVNITSGSLINLDIYDKIGGFNEDFFIEFVDNEYCLRLNSYGYDIYVHDKTVMFHEYGNQKEVKFMGRSFFPTFHPPLRYYYLTRNRIFIWKQYLRKFNYYLIWDFLSIFNSLFHIIAFEKDILKKIYYIIKGFIHGIINKKGKY